MGFVTSGLTDELKAMMCTKLSACIMKAMLSKKTPDEIRSAVRGEIKEASEFMGGVDGWKTALPQALASKMMESLSGGKKR